MIARVPFHVWRVIIALSAFIVILCVAWMLAPQSARAATLLYFEGSMNSGQWRLSSSGTIKGGEIQSEGVQGIHYAKVQTQNGYGYVAYSATGATVAAMSHAAVSVYTSACTWHNSVGGSTDVACWKYT